MRLTFALAIGAVFLIGGCADLPTKQERQDTGTILHAVASEIQHITIFKTKVVRVAQKFDAEKEQLKAQVNELQKTIEDLNKIALISPPSNIPAWYYWPVPVATLAGGYWLGIRKKKKKKK